MLFDICAFLVVCGCCVMYCARFVVLTVGFRVLGFGFGFRAVCGFVGCWLSVKFG